MPRPRLAMRKVREVLRLILGEDRSHREAAALLGMAPSTVRDHLARATAAGVTWPLPDGIDDHDLEARLFRTEPASATRPLPDWEAVHKELRRYKHVTLQLLWTEYREQHPDGYGYTQYVARYRQWAIRLDVVLRQEHRAGDKLFVDYAGDTVPITDPATGVVTPAQVFVAVLGASSYTYAELQPSQALPFWISGHVNAFEFMSGAPALLVPDNLASGVTKAHRYEPIANETYAEMAAHYQSAVLPARVRKPRDKAKAEAGVLLVERWIVAVLRRRTIFSIAEGNAVVFELLERINTRPFQKLQGSRLSLFQELDRPALRPLPERPYEYAERKRRTVNIDYHVEVDHHYYSVPYQLARQECEARWTATTVEIFHKGRRVASHVRSFMRGGFTTLDEHMPESHRRHLEWTPGRILNWAAETGPQTAAFVDGVMRQWPHPEQGFRACLGIMRLGQRYGADRLEAACTRALAIGSYRYRSIESILKKGLDATPLQPRTPPSTTPRNHAHVRGPEYYEN